MTYRYKVSVIVPCYNVKPYLDDCLQSLVDQTLQPLEIICVDDNSSDGTDAILKQWQSQYPNKIKTIQHRANLGLANTRNTAMQIAQGEFIGFVDADDWVDINTFELLYNYATRNNLDITMVKFKKYYSDDKIQKNDELNLFDKINIYNKQLHSKHIGDLFLVITNLWSCIFNNNFLRQHNIKMLPYNCYFAEEMPFVFQSIVMANQVGLVNEYLYYYRRNRNNQLTAKFDIKQFCVFDEFKYIMNTDSYKNNTYLQQATLTKQILVHITSIKHIAAKLKLKYAINAASDIFSNHSIINIYKIAIKLTFGRKLLYLPIIVILNLVYLLQKTSKKKLSVTQ